MFWPLNVVIEGMHPGCKKVSKCASPNANF